MKDKPAPVATAAPVKAKKSRNGLDSGGGGGKEEKVKRKKSKKEKENRTDKTDTTKAVAAEAAVHDDLDFWLSTSNGTSQPKEKVAVVEVDDPKKVAKKAKKEKKDKKDKKKKGKEKEKDGKEQHSSNQVETGQTIAWKCLVDGKHLVMVNHPFVD